MLYLLRFCLLWLVCYTYTLSASYVIYLLCLYLIYVFGDLSIILMSELSTLSTFFVAHLLSVSYPLHLYSLWLICYLYFVCFIYDYYVYAGLFTAIFMSEFAMSMPKLSVLSMSVFASMSTVYCIS